MAEKYNRDYLWRLETVQAAVDKNYEYLATQWENFSIESEGDLEQAAADGFSNQLRSLSDLSFRQSSITFTIFYASFFALWSFADGFISELIFSVAGLFMSVSLAFFAATIILGYWYSQKILDSAIENVAPLNRTAFDIDAEREPDAYRKAIKIHNQAVENLTTSHLRRAGRITKIAIFTAIFAVSTLIFGFGASVVRANPLTLPANSADYSLDDLSFMVGHWKGDAAMGGPEEGWFAPRDGVMAGLFRWPTVQGLYVLELLTIREEEDGVIFRFKHFDPEVIPWEKDRANTYRLTGVADGCATFTGLDNSDKVPATMQYCRTDAETLVFRGAGKDQALSETDFVLTFTDIDVLRRRAE